MVGEPVNRRVVGAAIVNLDFRESQPRHFRGATHSVAGQSEQALRRGPTRTPDIHSRNGRGSRRGGLIPAPCGALVGTRVARSLAQSALTLSELNTGASVTRRAHVRKQQANIANEHPSWLSVVAANGPDDVKFLSRISGRWRRNRCALLLIALLRLGTETEYSARGPFHEARLTGC